MDNVIQEVEAILAKSNFLGRNGLGCYLATYKILNKITEVKCNEFTHPEVKMDIVEEIEKILADYKFMGSDSIGCKLATKEILDRVSEINEAEELEIKRQCDVIKQLPLNTLEDIQNAKELSRKIPDSSGKVLLFYFLIFNETKLKEGIANV